MTNEQKELMLKLCRLTYTNIEIRDDSVVFLLDKDGFLSEGLPESAYLEYKLYESQVNYLFQRDAQSRKMILSDLATIITVYRNYFGYEYKSDIPILKFINEASQGQLPRIGLLSDDPVIYVVADDISADSLETIIRSLPTDSISVVYE